MLKESRGTGTSSKATGTDLTVNGFEGEEG
jgi:hypothetical protein